jgi:hypothetical protein
MPGGARVIRAPHRALRVTDPPKGGFVRVRFEVGVGTTAPSDVANRFKTRGARLLNCALSKARLKTSPGSIGSCSNVGIIAGKRTAICALRGPYLLEDQTGRLCFGHMQATADDMLREAGSAAQPPARSHGQSPCVRARCWRGRIARRPAVAVTGNRSGRKGRLLPHQAYGSRFPGGHCLPAQGRAKL